MHGEWLRLIAMNSDVARLGKVIRDANIRAE